MPAGATWRVTCTTCPVTMDYNPGRLNILYDRDTGVVREVKCG
ncbi:MAG: I78 family peptidase inhibitor [Brevundimonas sp.]